MRVHGGKDSDDEPPSSPSPPHRAHGTPTDKVQRNFTDEWSLVSTAHDLGELAAAQ